MVFTRLALPPCDASCRFDLDEQFAGERAQLAQITNKCSSDDDLAYYIQARTPAPPVPPVLLPSCSLPSCCWLGMRKRNIATSYNCTGCGYPPIQAGFSIGGDFLNRRRIRSIFVCTPAHLHNTARKPRLFSAHPSGRPTWRARREQCPSRDCCSSWESKKGLAHRT